LGLWGLFLGVSLWLARRASLNFPLAFGLALTLLYWGRPAGYGFNYLELVVAIVVWPSLVRWQRLAVLVVLVGIMGSRWWAFAETLRGENLSALPTLLLLALVISINARRETFRLAKDFNEAMAGRQRANNELELQSWVREQLRQLGVSREDVGFRSLGERTLESLVSATNAVVGSMYIVGSDCLKRCASHGVGGAAPARVPLGDGLLGEAAKTGKLRHLKSLPHDYLRIESTLGSTPDLAECFGAFGLDGRQKRK
jgi:hypothetical protein